MGFPRDDAVTSGAAIGLLAAVLVAASARGETPTWATGPGESPDQDALATADPSPARSPTTAAPLFESPLARRARLRAALEQRLSRTLGWLPGVVQARLHLTPEHRRVIGQPAAPARAVAVLRVSATAEREILQAEATKLIVGAVPNQASDAVQVIWAPAASAEPRDAAGVDTSAASAPPLTRVGPFAVVASDAPGLRATLTGLLGLNAILAAVLVALWRTRRSD
ncbi:MAG: hypothetical protein OXR73_24615 [Myxococcales bacterium]|nr:hypothetical protein [Myxococcales bacterium]